MLKASRPHHHLYNALNPVLVLDGYMNFNKLVINYRLCVAVDSCPALSAIIYSLGGDSGVLPSSLVDWLYLTFSPSGACATTAGT